MPRDRRGQTIRRIAGFFRPYRLQIAVVLVTIVVTSFLGLINPLLLKALIDTAIPDQNFAQLNLFVGLMIIVPIISGLIGVGQTYLNNMIGQRVMQDLRNALYAHLQRLPLRFFTETRTGEIQSRLSNDVGGIQSVVTDTASSVVANIVMVISTVVAMIIIDVAPDGALAGDRCRSSCTSPTGSERCGAASPPRPRRASPTCRAITEETLSVSGILLSKTFGQQAATIDRYRVANAKLAVLQLRQSMVGRWFFMIVGSIFSITPALVYWLAGVPDDPAQRECAVDRRHRGLHHAPGRLFFPLGQLFNVQVEVQGALALFDRIFEYLDIEPSIVDAPDAVALSPAEVRGRVRFRHVSFRYPSPPPAPARLEPPRWRAGLGTPRGGRGRSRVRNRRGRETLPLAAGRATAMHVMRALEPEVPVAPVVPEPWTIRAGGRRLHGRAGPTGRPGRTLGRGQDHARPTSCRGSTTSTRVPSRSTAWTCARSRSPASAR